jgi:isocitrate lyase
LTLNFRNQDDDMLAEGENMTGYDRNNLMDVSYDKSELCHRADDKIRTFQKIVRKRLGFSPFITLQPTTTALHMNDLTQGYFGREGMLA